MDFIASLLFTALLIGAGFLAAAILWFLWKLRKSDQATAEYLAEKPNTNFSRLLFEEDFSFNEEDPGLSAQSSKWQLAMQDLGGKLSKSKLDLVVFSHGTFVGNDPFGIVSALEANLPFANKKFIEKFQRRNRMQSNLIMGDQANFLPEYVKLFEDSIGGNIPCQNFNWSSGNHHAARLAGAALLLKNINTQIKNSTSSSPSKKIKRILFIGHSHAGQLFALFSHIIESTPLGQRLIELIPEDSQSRSSIQDAIKNLKKLDFDFVLYGTPYIYNWPNKSARRVLNVINHRGHEYLAGNRRGVLYTTDGDYIQQWGISGSDFRAMTQKDRDLNKKLTSLLGDGTNRSNWQEHTRSRLRVPPLGETILVDYQDSGSVMPNCFNTVFGHGVYTKYKTMHFNTKLICDKFY